MWQKGMMMLPKTLQQLQFQEYLCSNPDHQQDSQHIEVFQTMLSNAAPNKSAEWKYHRVNMKGLIDSIGDFNNGSFKKFERNNQFKFFCVFLKDMVSVLIDLNQSHRERN